jgi:NAD(P)-dependent dehydrogenase (short-subunit alcohol dehydrogenase family)
MPPVTRRAVVTGTSPVGAAVVRSLVDRGAAVATLAPAGDAEVVGSTTHVACEFGREDEVASAVEAAHDALGTIDLAVHTWMAPTLFEPIAFQDVPEVLWAQACEGSLAAAWWFTRQIGPRLRRGAPVALVLLVPTVGLTGAADLAMLATVSEGLRVLAKGAGRQWGTSGVTVHTIAAGPEHWVPSASDGSLLRAVSLSVPAMGGRGDLEADIAPLVSMLADADAHFWTAGTVVADGGVWMAL